MEPCMVALHQLASNPGRLAIFSLLVAALALLVYVLSPGARAWQLRRLSLAQGTVVAALLAIDSGTGWALSYDSLTIQGTIPSYLTGFSSIFLWLFRALSLVSCMALLLRSMARFVARISK